MRKTLFIAVFFFLSIVSCNQETLEDNKIEYWYEEHRRNKKVAPKIHRLEIKKSYDEEDKRYQFLHIDLDLKNKDTISYTFSQNNDNRWTLNKSILPNKLSDDEIPYVASKTVFSVDNEYEIFKFPKDPHLVDGCSTHFWNPEFGVILIWSVTWGNYLKLQTNDPISGEKINGLVEKIFLDTEFFRGCLDTMMVIPSYEYREYRKWKENQL